jgi:hypothetical protein
VRELRPGLTRSPITAKTQPNSQVSKTSTSLSREQNNRYQQLTKERAVLKQLAGQFSEDNSEKYLAKLSTVEKELGEIRASTGYIRRSTNLSEKQIEIAVTALDSKTWQ